MTLPPRLMQRLGRTRLLTTWVDATSGIGERRSRAIGSGMEFADHRRYQPGDDLRHLDRHVFARLKQHHVRQYAAEQQLPVTVLVDTSASMGFGAPSKIEVAKRLAAAVAYVAVVGGDSVLVGAMERDRMRWYPRFQGVRRVGQLVDWLDDVAAAGPTDLVAAAELASRRLPMRGLTVIVSDFLVDDLGPALDRLDRANQEVVLVHVLAPEEVEPGLLGAGDARLVDAETGIEVDTTLDEVQIAQYTAAIATFLEGVRGEATGRRGRHLVVRTDADLEVVVGSDWRRAGFVR